MRGDKGVKLTKRVIDQASGERGRHYIWDCELRGLGVQVEKSGTKTYFVRYRPKGQGRDGARRFYKLGRHGDLTPDEAREQAKRVLGAVAEGRDPVIELKATRAEELRRHAAPKIRDLGQLFLDGHVRAKRKLLTQLSYELILRRHIYPAIGEASLCSVSRSDLVDLHLKKKNSSPVANRMLAVISSMYSFAAKRGLVPEGFNPAKGIEKFREEGRERYLTSEELLRLSQALIEAETVGVPWVIDATNPKSKHTPNAWKGQREIVDPHAVAAIRLLLFTGARLREILDLTWKHVDLGRELLFLPDSKTGKKTIVLNAAALEILQQLRQTVAADRARLEGFVIKGLVDDQPRADLKRPWTAIRRHADLEGVRLHDLRHTFASIGAGASLGLPVVGKLLGHSQPQTTARYAHLDADPLRRAANIIGDHLSAAMRPKAPATEKP